MAASLRVALLRAGLLRVALQRAGPVHVTLLRSARLRVAPRASPSPFMRGPLRAGASRVGPLAGGLRVPLLRAGALLRAALPRITPLRAGPLRVAGLRRGPLRGTPLQPARRSALGRAVIVSAGPGIWTGCDRSVHSPSCRTDVIAAGRSTYRT